MYQFTSYSNYETGVAIGACIVEADTAKEGMQKAIDLDLLPTPNKQRSECLVYGLPSIEDEVGMELNKFYSKEAMIAMEFTTIAVPAYNESNDSRIPNTSRN